STAPSESLACWPNSTRSAFSRSSAFASTLLVATRSEPAIASSLTSTARSAPMASALRSESAAFSGPIETTTTSVSESPLSRSASSTAFASKWLSAPSPERSSRFVPGSRREWPSGTCFTQTAIFMTRAMVPAGASLHALLQREHVGHEHLADLVRPGRPHRPLALIPRGERELLVPVEGVEQMVEIGEPDVHVAVGVVRDRMLDEHGLDVVP